MTTNPSTIVTSGRRLLDALSAWMAGGDSAPVLDACAEVQAANDPANPVSRAETTLAATARRAVVLGDISAVHDLQDEMQVSNRIMHDANRDAFGRWLDTMDPARLTVEQFDLAAEVARDLRSQPG